MKNNFIFSNIIIFWYLNNKNQNFPWQINKTIYKVWLSEIMLQQTQVKTVISYYEKFIKKFPTIFQLAAAELDEILYLWSGLGYYNRAINLHKTAKIIVSQYSGQIPADFKTLISFPGIGRSTAGAILSLALNQRYPILDSNIKRILIRFYSLSFDKMKLSAINNKLWYLIETLIPYKNISIFNQAMMNLGQLICTQKKPICNICPINTHCQSLLTNKIKKHQYSDYTKKIKKKSKRIIWWILLLKKNTTIWLIKRSYESIWRNLFCFPEFNNLNILNKWLLEHNLYNNSSCHYMATLKHQISNINLEIQPILINTNKTINLVENNGIWYNLNKPAVIGLPKPVSIVLDTIKNNLNELKL